MDCRLTAQSNLQGGRRPCRCRRAAVGSKCPSADDAAERPALPMQLLSLSLSCWAPVHAAAHVQGQDLTPPAEERDINRRGNVPEGLMLFWSIAPILALRRLSRGGRMQNDLNQAARWDLERGRSFWGGGEGFGGVVVEVCIAVGKFTVCHLPCRQLKMRPRREVSYEGRLE